MGKPSRDAVSERRQLCARTCPARELPAAYDPDGRRAQVGPCLHCQPLSQWANRSRQGNGLPVGAGVLSA